MAAPKKTIRKKTVVKKATPKKEVKTNEKIYCSKCALLRIKPNAPLPGHFCVTGPFNDDYYSSSTGTINDPKVKNADNNCKHYISK